MQHVVGQDPRERTGCGRRDGTLSAQGLTWILLLCLLPTIGCTALPGEFNLSPLFRQRLDPDGTVLELDVLWPIVHYERLPDGSDDFRIRPLWRQVRSADLSERVEYQYLWPLGRIVKDHDEETSRLFPLWWHQSRENGDGDRETDWYALFPFFFGGSSDSGEEDYLSAFPIYADIPQFLTYDRFQTHLFPLHVATLKGHTRGHLWLWPLIGWGSSSVRDEYWHRFLPFYSLNYSAGRFARHSLMWPFVSWGRENEHTDTPFDQWAIWPLYGRQSGSSVAGWFFLWPFFGKQTIVDRTLKLDILWPIFRYFEDRSASTPIYQWWLWPIFGTTVTDDQMAWTALWPIIWWRQYDDPEGLVDQQWVLPFYWRVHRLRPDGTDDDFVKLWPLWHRERRHDGASDWALLSPWPWRQGNAYGVDEAYGWIWTLARGRTRASDDESFDLAGHIFTARWRHGRTQASVPFLFNFESDHNATVLRFLQLFPITLASNDKSQERREVR